MVDVDQALAWLAEERGTALSAASQNRIGYFSAQGLTPGMRRNIILALLRTATSLPAPFEQAEVFTYCGVFFYRLMQMNEAIRWLQQADDYYQYLNDPHRQACTSWMLYRVMRSSGQYAQAFDRGRRARVLFQEKEQQYHQLQDPKMESRYQKKEMDLTFDLLSTPEDSFEWLFEFNGTRMSPYAKQVKDRAQEHIERRRFDEADQDMKMLLEITGQASDCAETAEAMAYCGVGEWAMERQMNALYYFRAARAHYVPSPHEHALVTWMLGLAEWSFQDLHARAIATMESAIQKIDDLRNEAVWQNDPVKRDWYAMHHVAMRRVLTHLIG